MMLVTERLSDIASPSGGNNVTRSALDADYRIRTVCDLMKVAGREGCLK